MHITALEDCWKLPSARKNKKKQVRSGERCQRPRGAPSRITIAALRAARAELERAKQIENFDARRDAVRAWALGLGYKSFNNDDNQAWQAGVKSKFKRRLAAIGVR